MRDYLFRCDMSKQYKRYEKEIDAAIKRVLRRGVYILGKEVALFEKEFAGYIGTSHAVATASGTDALVLAMKAYGIGRGDKVVTTAYAPAPVATAIVLAGGVPVFCDIEETNCLIDTDQVKASLSSAVKFIMPVHLFGAVCDMPEIGKIAKKNRTVVIEDCAQAHGSTFNGRMAGTFGKLACFSFYPTKNLGCYGDGGMVLTDDPSLAEKLRLLRNYGKKDNPFDSEIKGYNSRLDELQAAVLRVKLRHLDEMNASRAKLVGIYREALEGLPVDFLEGRGSAGSNHHILTILCRERRDELIGFLESNGIQTNVYYPRPLPYMKAFEEYAGPNCSFCVSRKVSGMALALPLYPELEEKKAALVAGKIRKFFSGRGSGC